MTYLPTITDDRMYARNAFAFQENMQLIQVLVEMDEEEKAYQIKEAQAILIEAVSCRTNSTIMGAIAGGSVTALAELVGFVAMRFIEGIPGISERTLDALNVTRHGGSISLGVLVGWHTAERIESQDVTQDTGAIERAKFKLEINRHRATRLEAKVHKIADMLQKYDVSLSSNQKEQMIKARFFFQLTLDIVMPNRNREVNVNNTDMTLFRF